MEFRRFSASGSEYDAMVALRLKVLLDPIGVGRSYINPQAEANEFLLGAFEGNAIVACCILTPRGDGVVQLRQMGVDEGQQGKGVGRDLLAYAEVVARDAGYEELLLHARDTVIPFYQKSGYAIWGEPFTEVGIGHHKMRKAL